MSAMLTGSPAIQALTPTNSMVQPGGNATLTATVLNGTNPTGYSYLWSNTALAGVLSGPGSATMANNSYCSSSAQSTYTAKADATSGTIDTVTVKVYTAGNCGNGAGQALNPASATVMIDNAWVGSWVGDVESACGCYSGPQNFNITQINPTTLDFSPYYDATFSGNTALVNGGEVVFTLEGNAMSGYEADSCQNGTYTRHRPWLPTPRRSLLDGRS